MAQRKQYIIDKKFQLKTTFSIIGFVTVLSAIIIIAISGNIYYNNTKIENIHEIEDDIVHFLTSRTLTSEDTAFKDAIKDIAINHSKNMQTLSKIMKYNKIMMVSIFIFIILQTVILFVLLIRKTHKISGPIYVMSMYMKEIINGKLPNPRPLRTKDELREFYGVFIEMVNALKQKEGSGPKTKK